MFKLMDSPEFLFNRICKSFTRKSPPKPFDRDSLIQSDN